ncbi:DUF1722 domain-containing protein [candidate division WOR-3 bacterium]|uniref:DUF1722 domain-containing protein n=1 Tax=candidate division WOR-3 bacterium TaxID=2052148 RepID=A0A9D5K832_UNCW3|nr:DUF1722 domain-containing protein [candidate division WOR-3 bacterium]MBD3363890.1 DUF1722 domain-containing protein [candidate division WOR-3 bacterium]
MNSFARPRVFASKCLGFEACRYNGVTIPVEYIEHLKPFCDFVTVCPEVEIGLGIPRDPIRIIEIEGRRYLYQPAKDKDYTKKMSRFTDHYLEGLTDIDGFILKEKSPSCGLNKVKIYPGKGKVSPKAEKTSGFFGGAVRERFPFAAIEDEGRLLNFKMREHFYTKIFALARFRKVSSTGATSELVHFHASHKLLLMASNQKELRALGKIVANPARKHFPDIITDYREHFHLALGNPARYTSHINVLQHAMGYFKNDLSPDEKTYFLDLLEQYRHAKLPLSALISVIRSWITRFSQPYLADQVYFKPYPWELATISDSGKGRNL